MMVSFDWCGVAPCGRTLTRETSPPTHFRHRAGEFRDDARIRPDQRRISPAIDAASTAPAATAPAITDGGGIALTEYVGETTTGRWASSSAGGSISSTT